MSKNQPWQKLPQKPFDARKTSPPGRGAPGACEPPYLVGGYYQGENLRCDVYIAWAKWQASLMSGDRKPVTRNSLRSFYTMLRETKRTFDFARLKNPQGAWGAADAALCKMQMLAEYQRKRNVINDAAVTFLNTNIKEARKGEREFHAFVEHFQSVIAYLPERGRGE